MPPKKISNPKVSPEFVQELQDEPAYSNRKAYSATHSFLRRVIHHQTDQLFASIPAKVIKQQFDNYDIGYKACLDALVRHQIIEVDRHYLVGTKTRGYRLTDKGLRLMTAGELAYLRASAQCRSLYVFASHVWQQLQNQFYKMFGFKLKPSIASHMPSQSFMRARKANIAACLA
jgi:hypothetical protein